jgi:hypothetical protein
MTDIVEIRVRPKKAAFSMTQCNQLTTDGGSLLLCQADRKVGLRQRLQRCVQDKRAGTNRVSAPGRAGARITAWLWGTVGLKGSCCRSQPSSRREARIVSALNHPNSVLARLVGATIAAVWDPLPNPANAVRFVSPELVKARKAACGKLLGRPDRP